ncbi:MAG: hypothetical protein ACREKL_06020 [Chthoniobacterales bacterium]
MIARTLLVALLAAGSILTDRSAVAQTGEVADTIFMSDAAGTRRVGHIVGIDEKSLKVELPLPGGAMATVGVPRMQVSRVEFAPNAARDRLIAAPTAANAPALGTEWQRWKPFLAVPKSPAAVVGNAYASALLAAGNANLAAQALEIFKSIEQGAWSEQDVAAAKRGRLRALVATGHAADAVAEAEALAKESEDPTVLIEAKFILAEASQAKLRKLVEDNPRWNEDPVVKPEHDRLTNEALDLYLHPYLFLGSETEAASRGLWGAVQIYRFTGDDANAIESARDLTTIYAGTRYAAMAKDYLDKLPPEALKNQNAEKDAGTAN